MRIPSELPGADAPPLQLPERDPLNPRPRQEAIDKLYPSLPPLGKTFTGAEGPEGKPLTLSELQRMGDRLCAAVATMKLPHAASSTEKYVTISVGGAACVPQAAGSCLALIELADKALYQSKHAGRNRATTVEENVAAVTAA